jgi:hypothetical protein
MTPEAAAALFGLVKEFGLPLAMLGLFLWLWLTGKMVSGSQYERAMALYERERVDRIAAEQGLVKNSAASVDVAEAVRDALAEIAKPYNDRVEGRRGR